MQNTLIADAIIVFGRLNRYISLLNAELGKLSIVGSKLNVLIDTYRCLMQNTKFSNETRTHIAVLIDTYRCLMQNEYKQKAALEAIGLNRYISLLNAEPRKSCQVSIDMGLNRYISLLNAEQFMAMSKNITYKVLIDTYRCLMQNYFYEWCNNQIGLS